MSFLPFWAEVTFIICIEAILFLGCLIRNVWIYPLGSTFSTVPESRNGASVYAKSFTNTSLKPRKWRKHKFFIVVRHKIAINM